VGQLVAGRRPDALVVRIVHITSCNEERSMSNEVEEPGEGNSPAAWTAVGIMLVAVTAGVVFFWLDMPVLVAASVGLLIVGLIVGFCAVPAIASAKAAFLFNQSYVVQTAK
jgi:hypothetical protein